jgi:phosphoribosylamine---glycine ligase
MKILLIGSGGREHAIAWKLAQSQRLEKLYIAPGNPGTAEIGENVSLSSSKSQEIITFCQDKKIDLVVIGPETPLAEGLTDSLSQADIKVFGPSQKAAEIESSKAFAKAFMLRHNIPTAKYKSFTDYEQAHRHLKQINYPIVIKASGLASGKGVILPDSIEEAKQTLQEIMLGHRFGQAGNEVIIEERLTGPEVSLLSFCDGKIAIPMIPAQDHKRVNDDDQGPNTGGMGAYAPVPICPPTMVENLVKTILQPAVDGLRSEGRPFIGVLYAGLILTPDGPRVIEFNCRFGDPETQAILPLLESDLLEVFEACVNQQLDQIKLQWRSGSAVCIVLASGGYPGGYKTNYEIHGLKNAGLNTAIFQAGTKQVDNRIVTAGGRVLCVSGWGDDLSSALNVAYNAVKPIAFIDMHYRHDIAHQAK